MASFPRIRGDVPLIVTGHGHGGEFSPHTRGCSALKQSETDVYIVFPAYAGMFRLKWKKSPLTLSFPRIRGDVPRRPPHLLNFCMFSPHTRGCSATASPQLRNEAVFPAYAGMFLLKLLSRQKTRSFPRIRGDVPQAATQRICATPFSPHTRGCSLVNDWDTAWHAVFPAYAGMFRRPRRPIRPQRRFPRIRGDVPPAVRAPTAVTTFSPHTRGCSAATLALHGLDSVFPAYAGMFRKDSMGDTIEVCFPRIRGDVPFLLFNAIMQQKFSPHTRGCSTVNAVAVTAVRVFPAYAGMFRRQLTDQCVPFGFPRIRGDVPTLLGTQRDQVVFSPHTRGCSVPSADCGFLLPVFPAYAGMFRVRNSPLSRLMSFPRIRGDVPLHRWLRYQTPSVFPAYAGMFLRPTRRRTPKNRFPRIRGDVPLAREVAELQQTFSPHTRGCSAALE